MNLELPPFSTKKSIQKKNPFELILKKQNPFFLLAYPMFVPKKLNISVSSISLHFLNRFFLN